MAAIDNVIINYEDLPHTNWPKNVDKLFPKRMPYPNELPYINQYNVYWAKGDLSSANQVLVDHSDILDAMIDLDFLLTIHHSQIAMERFFRDQVYQYIRDLQNASVEDMESNRVLYEQKLSDLYGSYEALVNTRKTEIETIASAAISSVENKVSQAKTDIQNKVTDFENRIQSLTEYKGTFAPAISYKKYDVISYTVGETINYFMVIADETTGNLPTSDNFVPLTIKGDKGESGIGMTPRGVYNSTLIYYQYDIVSHNQRLWYAKQDNFSNKSPSEGSVYWELFLVLSQSSTDINMSNDINLQTYVDNLEVNINNQITDKTTELTQRINSQIGSLVFSVSEGGILCVTYDDGL